MTLNNKIFGELEYNIGWTKKESIVFWENEYTVLIRISSEENQQPNNKQEQAYSIFKNNLFKLSKESYIPAQKYIDNIDVVYSDSKKKENGILTSYVKPTEVLIFTTGDFAIICQINGVEDELIILYHNGDIKVDGGYLIESYNLI